MSDPERNYESSLGGAQHEIISAMSSLHMDGLELEDREKDTIFLDEIYVYVKHAREHLMMALQLIEDARKERET